MRWGEYTHQVTRLKRVNVCEESTQSSLWYLASAMLFAVLFMIRNLSLYDKFPFFLESGTHHQTLNYSKATNCESCQQENQYILIENTGHPTLTSSMRTAFPVGTRHHHCFQSSSVAQSCPTLCDPMNRSTPGLPVHHQLPEFTQTHVHRDSDSIQPSHPLLSPSPPAPNPSQHQGLFQ